MQHCVKLKLDSRTIKRVIESIDLWYNNNVISISHASLHTLSIQVLFSFSEEQGAAGNIHTHTHIYKGPHVVLDYR